MFVFTVMLRKRDFMYVNCSIDCSQSPIFSWDRLDIPRLTVTASLRTADVSPRSSLLRDVSRRKRNVPQWGWARRNVCRSQATSRLSWFSNVPRGAGVGDYSARRLLPNRPRPLSSFDTHARWQPVTQSPRSRFSYGKIEDCEQSNCSIKFVCIRAWLKLSVKTEETNI